MNDTTNTTNITVTKPAKVNEHTAWYTEHFSRPIWVTELAGPKPSIESLKVAHVFGRPGLQTLAMAMFMRPNGATNSEVEIACGNSQRNKMFATRPPLGLVALGKFKQVGHPKRGGLMVYKVELTPKGAAEVEAAKAGKASKASAKPADKGKGKTATPVAAKPGKRISKPAKATVTPAKPEGAPDGAGVPMVQAVPVEPVTTELQG